MKTFFVLPVILLIACSEPTRFEKLSFEETGIDFRNSIVEKDTFNILHNEYMYNGGGVGIGDLNNDGLQDIVFTGNKVISRVYLNSGNLRFTDITSRFQGLSNDQWYSGVAIADVNGDGWSDVYLTSTTDPDPEKRKNRLWINQKNDKNGVPSFSEMATSYGIDENGYSVHAAFLDYDLDGDLDLYVLNNIVNSAIPTNYRQKIADGSAINNDAFYRNEGNGKFVDVTKEAGVVYEGFGLGVAVSDINKDSYPDLYISNDYISNDLLYINQGDGTFANESPDYLSYQSKFSMGNDIADVNNDGNPEIFTTDMMPEQYFRKKQTINGHSYFFYVNDEKFGYEHQYVRNMLHVHNGFINGEMLPLSEVGQMANLFQTEWSWSPLFADYDNDGDKDLLITNGFPKDLTDKDFTNYKAQVYGYIASDEHMLRRIPVVKVSNYAFENAGDLRFDDQTEAWGMNTPSFSNGAAFADLDNDGDLDYVVNNINDVAFVYRNNTRERNEKVNYLQLKLTGAGANTMAIGAKVELWSGGDHQFYEHFLSRGYISSVDPVIHFGLGGRQKIDSIRILWPGGRTQTFLEEVEANQLLAVDEKDATPFSLRMRGKERLLFEEDHAAISYVHSQEDYVDFFQNQRILQHKFSQIGPCLAQGDLDNDGSDDLIIGATDLLPTMVYVLRDNRFVQAAMDGLTDRKGCVESDLAISDVDGDGDNDVVAIAGGYANENENDYRHYLYVNNGGSFSKTELSLPPFPASVVRPFDFDHDGDEDFFVGSRVKRGSFPLGSPSYLVINDKGRLTTSQVVGFDLGMVTDAVWSDYDNDGWEDLIVAREWNTLVILKSVNGKEFSVVNDGLQDKYGLWSSIAAGDLDGDGDDDYIAGNLGENHRFNVSEASPMHLYAIDVDKNSFIDPLTTAYWQDAEGVMQEYPVNYLDELAAQSPFFRKKFTSYTQFSYATIDSILDRSKIPGENLYKVNTTTSFVLWNEGGGQLRFAELPSTVQRAPVNKIMIRDLNADSFPDVLIAGNDHTHDVSTGIYDANRGVVLAGAPDRGLRPVPPAESGLCLKGQVTSMLYFEGKIPLLVTGINRDSLVVYRHAVHSADF